jgi:uncharacterized membrane protein
MLEWSPLLSYALDWVNLLLRWVHVIVAIAWVGSSFYFVWLDNTLTPPADPQLKVKGVGGELWAVHGGGFYNPQKYLGAPPSLPDKLHWFFWESYSTWLSGFALFTVLYLFNARTFLIDTSVHAWSPGVAVASALGFLAGFWLLYDLVCRALGQGKKGDQLVGVCVLVIVVGSAWAACQLFAGRAAFLLVGAMMATAMSANVLFWIIPGQRKVVAAIRAGQPVDPIHGKRGKQRSVHNTYFVLPVLFAMLSNHYGWAYGHAHNWLVLVLIMLAGALIRQFFVARHKTELAGQAAPWGWALAGGGLLLGVAIWLAPSQAVHQSGAGHARADFAQVQAVISQRCALCHNAQLSNKGVRLDSIAHIQANAQQIYQQAVVLKTMPMNNATGITDAERDVLRLWYLQREAP